MSASVSLSLVMGCTGLIGDAGAGGGPSGVETPPRPGEPPVIDPYTPGDDPLALPLTRIWRLSPLQYERSFRAAFGTTHVVASDFDTDARRDGFDDIASQNHIDASWAITVRRNAAEVGAELAPMIASRHACLASASPTDACVDDFVAELATPAFRHPTTIDERAPFVALFAALHDLDEPVEDTIAAIVEAVAQSPMFLYRIEIGEPRGDGTSALDAFTLASQLSFMLTDSPPDAQLWDAALAGDLSDRAMVLEHAERLLETPEAVAKVTKFFDQYLGTYPLREGPLPKDSDEFPSFSPEVQAAMMGETDRFVRHVVFETEGTLRDLYESDVTFIDETLRQFYGWDGTATPDAPFSIPNSERAGVFMQGSVLAARSGSLESDALHRGLFVYRKLLCNDIAPPEGLDVNTLGNLLDSPDPEDTERQRYEFLQENSPECAGCHGLFVPLGLALEPFDAVGVFRTEQNGRTLDASGTLRGSDNDGAFDDGRELLGRIGDSAKGQACFAEHWVSFAFGGEYEVPMSASLVADFRSHELRVRDLLLLATQQDAFYLRTNEVER